MVDKERRKELLQEYAERPAQNGIFAVRNSKTGEVWVGASRNIDTQQNGLWVRLKGRMLVNKDVQDSWNKHGETKFSYSILERITDTDPHTVERLLPERSAAWRQQLKAGVIKGT